jgi:hypothetical protein
MRKRRFGPAQGQHLKIRIEAIVPADKIAGSSRVDEAVLRLARLIGRRMAPEAFEGNQAEYLYRTKPERCGQPLQPLARDGGRFVERSDAHVIR